MIIRKTILYCTYINDIYTDTFISLILLKYKKCNLQNNNYLHMYILLLSHRTIAMAKI